MKSLHEPAAATEAVDSADSLVGQLADDYLRRCEAGEQPSVAEYADRYPEHAERIRGALAMLSLLKHSSAIGGGIGSGDVVRNIRPLAACSATFASCTRSAAAAWASSTRRNRFRSAAASP
jgi:hypothetical protein